MPNQNNNEEWREEFDKQFEADEYRPNKIYNERVKDFIASQISQAEQRGKREGLEEARDIFSGIGCWQSGDATQNFKKNMWKIEEKINQLK